MLDLIGYLADAWILGTYYVVAHYGHAHTHNFHLANALGCLPLLTIEVRAGAWPVIPLTATFGAIGAYGLWKERHAA